MKYKNEDYFEKNIEFIELRAFLRNQSYLTKEEADSIAEDMVSLLALDEDTIDFAADDAIRMGLKTEQASIKEQFLRLLYHMDNNIRKHVYGGHTKAELGEIHYGKYPDYVKGSGDCRPLSNFVRQRCQKRFLFWLVTSFACDCLQSPPRSEFATFIYYKKSGSDFFKAAFLFQILC